MNLLKNKTGFTLFELILAVAVLGMVMTSFQGVLGQFLSTHKDTREKLEQVSQARFAMDRIAMLIRETGRIEIPSAEELVIEERSMDAYNNLTQAFTPDGFLDADKDSDLVMNADDPDDVDDPVDWTTISLDKTDPDNWKLVEVMPDYSTASASDFMSQRTLCENVVEDSTGDAFKVTLESELVTIKLVLGSGINQVSLTTRAIIGKPKI